MILDWDTIDRLAKNARLVSPTQSPEYLRRQLEIWWSVTFKRPLKDPLLKEYSIEELIYEYLIHFYLDPENDPRKKMQREKDNEDEMAWAIEQIKKEQEKKKSAADSVEGAKNAHAGTDGLFIKPSDVPDIPFTHLPQNISTDFRE